MLKRQKNYLIIVAAILAVAMGVSWMAGANQPQEPAATKVKTPDKSQTPELLVNETDPVNDPGVAQDAAQPPDSPDKQQVDADPPKTPTPPDDSDDDQPPAVEPPAPVKPVEPPPADNESYLTFTGDEFNQLFNEVPLANLAPLPDPPAITDDEETDQRIRQIATDRGYRLRPMPADVNRLVVVEAERHRLQPEAAAAYEELKAAAQAEGLGIWLVSAYRSYDYQRGLFLRKVSAPYSDEAIDERLKLVAIPGYSKHQTGYTIDLAEGNLIFGDFAQSASYAWLLKDNYLNAKKYGWIPSYPPDATKQGPNPEPWEFTYVGKQHLLVSETGL